VVQDPWGRRQVPLFGCHFGKRLSVPLSKELRTTRSLSQLFFLFLTLLFQVLHDLSGHGINEAMRINGAATRIGVCENC